MSETIKLKRLDHIAVITMMNPPANTWTEDSLELLATTIAQLNNDEDIWSLVLTGEGHKFFSAGADLKLFADGDVDTARRMADLFGHAFETLSDFDGVSIAAINGYAMGGGLEAALACDIRIAETQTVMALPETKVGLLPCAGGTQNLSWLTGEGWAKKMILCGERVDAYTAHQIGLVEEVVEQGEALNRALDLARQVSQQSPMAVSACKRLIQSARRQPLKNGYILERELFVDLFQTEDQCEGVNAFLEKRAAQWKNR
ncbi:putative Enoyl-CoA hydratase/crotonase [Vibrio nigripulchritudo SFn27]|uniref:Putative Enoyl-CoA hydratase/crotonase n=1 Tax=Vibrio nigripulchritudo TaxID=28173 RepID=U4K378_9VIBR|nr:enoyl-CoA hydratase [Vibrio nigripulchritudo]CCN83828.1 putative Enoyl-CoA hydratase/crotonase [Vibrio nigripulchritudo BLFn1]CCN87164.1 putative Enoyl-CoA hydratase/crotonase [Vibrio nigripulchritudo SFn27]CCN94520.1 putative Enoyl-CoA hydratase/crotonase [Vibrio nigripulchritudo ENn2]CCO40914.1 putative Enoyl-CoA hydratase/crotonase [Vibrio nigripulchritudo SFn135]CCO54993.1 putative Enoyl-CoA hydratase/crotonase [Vibrio nigripulchritudo Wn13]